MKTRPFFKRMMSELAADNITDVAAMMAYYTLFALFPMLVLVITITLLVVPTEALQEGVQMVSRAMPGDVAGLIQEQILRMEQSATAGFAIGSALLAVWGASRGAASLTTALNDMYEKKETRPWWKRQLIAIGVTIGVAILLTVAIGLLAAGPAIGHAIADRFGLGAAFDVLWSIGRWVGALFLVMLVWAILYKTLPDTDAPFKIFTPGAAVGVALWLIVTRVFGFYLENFGNYEATYGALGTVVIFMTWLWLSNLALLVGAEVNDVLAELRKDKDPAAAKLAQKEKSSFDKSGGKAQPQPG